MGRRSQIPPSPSGGRHPQIGGATPPAIFFSMIRERGAWHSRCFGRAHVDEQQARKAAPHRLRHAIPHAPHLPPPRPGNRPLRTTPQRPHRSRGRPFADARRADLRHGPAPAREDERACLGLLGRLASIVCLIELYSGAPREDDALACLGKLIAFHRRHVALRLLVSMVARCYQGATRVGARRRLTGRSRSLSLPARLLSLPARSFGSGWRAGAIPIYPRRGLP